MNPYGGANLLKPCNSREYELQPPRPYPYCQTPDKKSQALTQSPETCFWELLSPALFGTTGALLLSVFPGCGHSPLRRGGKVFKLSIVLYSVGTTIAASFAVTRALKDSEPPHEQLLYPIATVLASVIVFFGAEYLLLYRLSPDSFTGDVGDGLGIQFLNFLYFSITSIATANLGDIMPKDLAARALISTEMLFFLYTITTAIQLILVRF